MCCMRMKDNASRECGRVCSPERSIQWIGKGNLQLPGPETEPSKISQEDGSSSSNPRQGSWKSDVDKVWREHFL